MKVNTPVINPLQIKPISKPVSDKPNKTVSFNSIFHEALLKNNESTKAEIKTSRLETTPVILPMGMVKEEDETDLVHRIENCLNTLEEYAFQLADPEIPLSLLNRSIHELKTQTGKLGLESDPLKYGEDLQGILAELIESSTTEIKHFEQGDYVGLN